MCVELSFRTTITRRWAGRKSENRLEPKPVERNKGINEGRKEQSADPAAEEVEVEESPSQ